MMNRYKFYKNLKNKLEKDNNPFQHEINIYKKFIYKFLFLIYF